MIQETFENYQEKVDVNEVLISGKSKGEIKRPELVQVTLDSYFGRDEVIPYTGRIPSIFDGEENDNLPLWEWGKRK
jgi:hypothetical protein